MTGQAALATARTDLEHRLGELRTAGRITWSDVLHVRQLLYRQEQIDWPIARLIFELNRSANTRDPGWFELYLEILTDCFLDLRSGLPGISDQAATCILAWIEDGAATIDLAERRLLFRLLLRSHRQNPLFRERVLAIAAAHLIHADRRLGDDAPRRPGTIDAVDLQLVRRLLFGPGAQDDAILDRPAAGFLAKLWEGVDAGRSNEDWPALFAYAVGKYLAELSQDAADLRVADPETLHAALRARL